MRSAIAIVLAASVAGCGGQTLSFSVRAGPPPAAVAVSRALSAGNGIVLSRVRVVIRKVELEKAGTTLMEEVASGPYLLDLSGASLDSGKMDKVLDTTFPAGDYDEVELEIHKAETGEVGVNADLKEMIDAKASIIVDGTIDGATFAFKTAVNAKQEFKGNMTLKDGSNLTLSVDPSTWFTVNGARLDPTNEANRSQIENNIQKSLKCFKDDDRDGRSDL
jgi:hypothetical protein